MVDIYKQKVQWYIHTYIHNDTTSGTNSKIGNVPRNVIKKKKQKRYAGLFYSATRWYYDPIVFISQ